jgi:tetratricopeptide (TPR) repeat protein
MAERRWEEAAQYLDDYADADPENWEVHFSRGVAHTKSRAGRDSHRAALRAYNDALVYLPEAERSAWLARLLAYRGAILKRLNRLDEAKQDLLLAQRVVSDADEAHDIAYNLAGVYAMEGDTQRALELLESLRGTSYIDAVHAHAHDYFSELRDDPEFRALLHAG